MDILALSVWVRYIQNFDKNILFPNKCYRGEYIKLLAERLKNKKEGVLLPSETVKEELSRCLLMKLKKKKN